MKFHVAVALLVIVAARSVSGQANPEDVVRAFFKAEDEGRWIDAARLLDLQRFERIRANTLKVGDYRAPFIRRTPEDLMKFDPDMPRAAAEYQIKKMNEDMRDYDFLSHQYARTSTLESLRTLPIEEVAARWLEAKGPDWAAELSARERKRHPDPNCPEIPDSIAAKLKSEWRRPLATVLGATAGSDSLRYVVVGMQRWRPDSAGEAAGRDGESGMSGMSPNVLTVRRVGGAWRIVPLEDMPDFMGFSGNVAFVSAACGLGDIDSVDSKR